MPNPNPPSSHLPTTHSPAPLEHVLPRTPGAPETEPLPAKAAAAVGPASAQAAQDDPVHVHRDLKALVVTYNVNRYLISDTLSSIASALTQSPDLIAVALQEAAPDSAHDSASTMSSTGQSSSTLLCLTNADNDANPAMAHQQYHISSSNTRSHPNLLSLPTPAFKGLLTDPITAHWWLDKIICDLGCSFTRRAYIPLTTPPIVLGGTLLAVLVAVDIRHRIDDVRASLTAVGPFGFPNKGAVGVSLLWDHHTRVAIVGAHLPHGTRAAPRDRALDKVFQGLVFEPNEEPERPALVFPPMANLPRARVAPATPSPPRLRSRIRTQENTSSAPSPTSSQFDSNDNENDSTPLLASSASSPPHSPQPGRSPRTLPLTLADHDITILAGDLNYRTSLPTFAAATSLLANHNWASLLTHDQLAHSSQVHAHGWCEPPIEFGPTYRVIPVGRPLPELGLPDGTVSLLDPAATATAGGRATSFVGCTVSAEVQPIIRPELGAATTTPTPTRPWWPISYDPRRVPGWTDRILVRTPRPTTTRVHAHLYAAFPMLRQSDHVPVAALLSVAPQPSLSAAAERNVAAPNKAPCLWVHRASVAWTLWLVFVLESRVRTVGVMAGLCLGVWVFVFVAVWVLGWM